MALGFTTYGLSIVPGQSLMRDQVNDGARVSQVFLLTRGYCGYCAGHQTPGSVAVDLVGRLKDTRHSNDGGGNMKKLCGFSLP